VFVYSLVGIASTLVSLQHADLSKINAGAIDSVLHEYQHAGIQWKAKKPVGNQDYWVQESPSGPVLVVRYNKMSPRREKLTCVDYFASFGKPRLRNVCAEIYDAQGLQWAKVSFKSNDGEWGDTTFERLEAGRYLQKRAAPSQNSTHSEGPSDQVISGSDLPMYVGHSVKAPAHP